MTMKHVPLLVLTTLLAAVEFTNAGISDITPEEWSGLSDSLSSTGLLSVPTDGFKEAWRNECVPMFEAEGFPGGLVNSSNYQLIDQPSGVCQDALSCAYKSCEWPFTPSDAFDENDMHEDKMNLPAAVVFPKTAGDIVASLTFASEHKIGVSILSTGHSYWGGGQQKDSLNINMSKFPKPSDKETVLTADSAIIQCIDTPPVDPSSTNDLEKLACEVAKSRSSVTHESTQGTSAIVHVGGGQLFDEVLQTVHTWNRDKGEVEYMVHTGNSGTVGAAGGFILCGGVSGNAPMRRNGVIVDMIAQLEMVLPSGQHVRFGPTEWVDEPGMLYPQTTTVTGWCNSKSSEADPSEWQWGECDGEDKPNFADLWYAVRGGGGGGVYGVITGVYYILYESPGVLQVVGQWGTFHDRLDLEIGWRFDAKAAFAAYCDRDDIDELKCSEAEDRLDVIWMNFLFGLYDNPSSLGLEEKHAVSCGSSFNAGPYFFDSTKNTHMCYYGVGADIAAAWGRHVDRHNDEFVNEFSMGNELVDLITQKVTLISEHYDFVELTTARADERYDGYQLWPDHAFNGVPEGRAVDVPKAATIPSGSRAVSYNIGKSHAGGEHRERLISYFMDVDQALRSKLDFYVALGGRLDRTSDGMDAFSQYKRDNSAFLTYNTVSDSETMENMWEKAFFGAFGEGYTSEEFPGISDHCHGGNALVGPLRTDWTKACPPSLTGEAKREQCITWEEITWGSDQLERLRAIQKNVDPFGLFKCYGCIDGHVAADDGATDAPDEGDTVLSAFM